MLHKVRFMLFVSLFDLLNCWMLIENMECAKERPHAIGTAATLRYNLCKLGRRAELANR
jgi:hypothetical protein